LKENCQSVNFERTLSVTLLFEENFWQSSHRSAIMPTVHSEVLSHRTKVKVRTWNLQSCIQLCAMYNPSSDFVATNRFEQKLDINSTDCNTQQ